MFVFSRSNSSTLPQGRQGSSSRNYNTYEDKIISKANKPDNPYDFAADANSGSCRDLQLRDEQQIRNASANGTSFSSTKKDHEQRTTSALTQESLNIYSEVTAQRSEDTSTITSGGPGTHAERLDSSNQKSFKIIDPIDKKSRAVVYSIVDKKKGKKKSFDDKSTANED